MNSTRYAAFVGFVALGFAATPTAGQQNWQWNGRVGAGDAIEIKGINGGIRAVASNDNEVRVSAAKQARRSDPDEVRFEVVPHADGVTICAMYPARRGTNECRPGSEGRMSVENNDVVVEWIVQVPRGVNFVGRTVNGSIDAAGLPADVDAHTVNGALTISTAGIIQGNTVNGDIDVTLARSDWSGAIKLATTNGDISISLPSTLSARVTAATVNGDIETDFPIEVSGRFGPKRLSGTIGSGGRDLSLNTVNGSVALKRR